MENELKCQKCGAMVDVHASECPQCGENLGEYTEQLPDNAYKIPRTIDELKQFYEDKSIPVRSMRFFIGEDYAAPRPLVFIKTRTVSLSSIRTRTLESGLCAIAAPTRRLPSGRSTRRSSRRLI